MNVTKLREKFNQKVFGTTTSGVSTTVIDDYLNEAYQDFLLLALPFTNWKINGEIAYTDITAGEDEYNFQLDLMKVNRIKINDEYLEDNQYEMRGGLLILLDESLYEETITDGLQVEYQSEFTALSAITDSPLIPTVFHPFLYIKASQNYCEDKEMWNKFNSLDKRLKELEEQIKNYYYSISSKKNIISPSTEDYY
jgi:hypothetical protein